MKLAGMKALITGGNSGIGLATARLFIAEGAEVAITGRDQATLDAAVAELGAKAAGYKADAADPAARAELFRRIGERFGALDVVFANAGVAGPTPLASATQEQFEQILRINITGVFFTVQGALPYLREGGSVVLNGSVVAALGPVGSAAYVASKGAVRAMARTLAAELSPKKIRVNVVVPGAIETPIWGRTASGAARDGAAKKLAGYAAAVPLERLGVAEDIAKAVLFLASSDSSYLQGTETVVDGGLTGAPLGAPGLRG
ncbi:MAG TPA: SDR family oxidoreductase [Candidatus Solibacter sp.]|nr:SDR family oxidoreductase [Candidatus Solibacter sp.]